MRSFDRLFMAALIAGAASTTACSPFAGIEGEWTRGERGVTRWQTLDGLCPGLGGGCNLEAPLAVGATVNLAVDGIEGAAVTASFTGGVAADGPPDVGEDRNTLVPIRVTAAGPGRVELSDSNGVIDAATITGRVATRLECGRWGAGDDLEWRMSGLNVTTAITLPMGSDDDLRIVCRASDASGPMLSADAIDWNLVSGSENLQIRNTDFGTLGSSANGARIAFRTVARGTAVVRATIGEVSTDLTITIE